MAVLHKLCNIKYKRSTLHHKDCSKSILHSPTDSLIQITQEDRNAEYLLKVNTQQKDLNLTFVPKLLLDLPLALESPSVLHK